MLAQKMIVVMKNRVTSFVLLGFAIYLLMGVVYRGINLYCWQMSIWEYLFGSPLQPAFAAVDLLTWPFWLALDLAHGVGVFGTGACAPPT